MQDRDELIARAIEHAEAYDTPKADDARRRYTPAQMEIAVRHALAALESRPAPTEERVKAAYDAGLKTLTYYIKSKHDFSIEYMAMGVVQDALRALATDTTPSRDEEGSVDREAIPSGVYYNAEAGNFYESETRKGLGNAFHSKWHPRRNEFPTDAMFTKTSTPETQIVEVEYEVWQKDAFGDGDAMVAGSTSLAEANHYAAVYSQDGPAWVVEVRRRALSASPTEVVEGKLGRAGKGE